MISDLEKDNVMRTNRASCWRSVLFQRSTWAVSPISLPTAVCCSSGMTEAETLKKSVKQWPWRYSCGIASHNRWHVLRAPIPNSISHHLSCLAAQSYPHPGVVGFFEHTRPAFVQFQYRGSGILWVRGEQGGP